MTAEVTNIWTEFHNELKGFILKKVRHQADTDDILQDIFVKIIRNIDRVKQAENLRPYLYGIVKNAINDHFRRIKFTENIADIPEKLSEEETESLNSAIADCCIKPFVNKLPEKYKEALILTEFQDVSQKDLAKKLNISYSGAKSRVQRGKEKLKEFFLECCAYQIDSYGNLIEAKCKERNCSKPA